MTDAIELALTAPGGIIDVRLDPLDDRDNAWTATILYPNMVNGYNRSEIFCYTFRRNDNSNNYFFDEEELHPKIRKLEQQLSAGLANALKQESKGE